VNYLVKEVWDQLMAAEEASEAMIQEARARSAALMVKTRQDLMNERETQISEAKRSGEELLKREIEAAHVNAGKVKDAAMGEIATLRQAIEERLDAAVQFIVEEILG
jgi:vacuolar-type H+-ATPase subunit H